MLGDGDVSDNEGEGFDESSVKTQVLPDGIQNPISMEGLSKGGRSALTRYHAFLELLTTEVGYPLGWDV